MSQPSELVQRYVIDRGLIDREKSVKDTILNDDALLGSVASINADALKALIMARIQPIEEEILSSAYPPEIIPLRQAMVEVARIFDDHERYVREFEARKKQHEEEQGGSTPAIEEDNGTT